MDILWFLEYNLRSRANLRDRILGTHLLNATATVMLSIYAAGVMNKELCKKTRRQTLTSATAQEVSEATEQKGSQSRCAAILLKY